MKRSVPELSASLDPAFGTGASGSHRLPQLASLIQHELGVLLPRELELPTGVFLTVTKVTVADDLSAARVGVSVLPFERRRDALLALAAARRELQRSVNQRLRLYRVPKLEFYFDESAERAATVEGLLDKLRSQG